MQFSGVAVVRLDYLKIMLQQTAGLLLFRLLQDALELLDELNKQLVGNVHNVHVRDCMGWLRR
jgi:hypothetical protein